MSPSVDRIDHYEQRLKALYYKKKFNERMSDAKNKVDGECCSIIVAWGIFFLEKLVDCHLNFLSVEQYTDYSASVELGTSLMLFLVKQQETWKHRHTRQ